MRLPVSFFLLLAYFNVGAQRANSPEIIQSDLKSHMNFLASDALDGRFPGSKGDRMAADYIATNFKVAGLSLYQNTGFQNFEVLTRQEFGKKNSLTIDGKKLKFKTDFSPFPFSGNGSAEAPIVFAGYGIDIKTDTFQWNDYSNLEVRGKIVLILRGAPESARYQSLFDTYSDDIVKAINARDKGAAAVLFVSGKKFDDPEKFPIMNLKESSAGFR